MSLGFCWTGSSMIRLKRLNRFFHLACLARSHLLVKIQTRIGLVRVSHRRVSLRAWETKKCRVRASKKRGRGCERHVVIDDRRSLNITDDTELADSRAALQPTPFERISYARFPRPFRRIADRVKCTVVTLRNALWSRSGRHVTELRRRYIRKSNRSRTRYLSSDVIIDREKTLSRRCDMT